MFIAAFFPVAERSKRAVSTDRERRPPRRMVPALNRALTPAPAQAGLEDVTLRDVGWANALGGHLHETLRVVRFREAGSRMGGAGGRGRDEELVFNGEQSLSLGR